MDKIEDVILFQIDQTSKVSKQYSQREFDRLGLPITVEQWIILKIVAENEDLSQKELARKSYRDPASITRTIDLLEKKQFLMRKAISNNRRTYHIGLTTLGKQFVEENMPIISQHRQLSIKGLSQEDLTALSSLLSKIRTNMK